MIIEPDMPKAKKLINKRMRKQSIKMIGLILLFVWYAIVVMGISTMATLFCTLILLGFVIPLMLSIKFAANSYLKGQQLTLTQNSIQMQTKEFLLFDRFTPTNILWSDIERIKFNDNIITIHLTPDAPHKRKTYQFDDFYTLDLSKIYSEIEQRWLGEKTVG